MREWVSAVGECGSFPDLGPELSGELKLTPKWHIGGAPDRGGVRGVEPEEGHAGARREVSDDRLQERGPRPGA